MDWLLYICVGGLLILIIMIIYWNYLNKNMVYVKSPIDNKYYLVRNEPDKANAANLLARIKEYIMVLSTNLYNNKSDPANIEYTEYIIRLYDRVPSIVIIESTQDSVYTSYSVNKGEQIVFCLRSRLNINKMHDLNLMMYIVLHEISHVACPVYDNHGPLFRKIFAFITNSAIRLNLYKKIDFVNNPVEYCGLNINESIV